MSKFYEFLLIGVLLSGILVGCHGKLEETYVLTSLKSAARGDVVSVGFKYGFDTPNVIGASKGCALVREGNEIDFFVGQDIERKIKGVEGKKYTMAVRKYFTPYIHFVVDFLVAGSDTIQVGEPSGVKFLVLRPVKEFTTPEEYIAVDLNKLTPNGMTLREIQDKKFQVQNAKIVYEQIPGEGGTGMKYVLRLKNVRFIIDETSDSMLAICSALVKENLPFNGGVSYGTIPAERSYREELRIGGDIKINYVIYGGNACMFQM